MILNSGYVFTPATGSTAGTIDFSGVPNFRIAKLLGIKHQPSGRTLYAPFPGLTGTISGSVLTLAVDTTGLSASDPLIISYAGGILTTFELATLGASTSPVQVRGSTCQIFKVNGWNNSTGPRRMRFYNAIPANITVGTTTPVLTRTLAPSTAFAFDFGNTGILFPTALSIAVVQNAALTDATAPAAADITDLSFGFGV